MTGASGWRRWLPSPWVFVMLAALFAWHWWHSGLHHAVVVVGVLLATILLATWLWAVTPVTVVLDALRRVLPESAALAVALMLRAIPETTELARETRSAAKARGLERSPRAFLVPFVLRVIARALHRGEALHARGVLD